MKVDIGIPEDKRLKVAEGLGRILAETYILYIKTHNYHWNVTGQLFQTLHLMFEVQYKELALAVDDIAERIRSLGLYAPGTYEQFSRLSSIKERSDVPKAREMIADLVHGHETLSKSARSVFPLAEQANDQASIDLLTGRMEFHEKKAWMLRSLLEDQ